MSDTDDHGRERGTADIDPAADAEQHRPGRGRPVAQIVDQLLDLYDTGDFVSMRTWELIGELVLRIPDNDAVTYPSGDLGGP